MISSLLGATKLVLSVARIPMYILVSSGVGVISGAALSDVVKNTDAKGAMGDVGVKAGVWALQGLVGWHATQFADGTLVSIIEAVEKIEKSFVEESENSTPREDLVYKMELNLSEETGKTLSQGFPERYEFDPDTGTTSIVFTWEELKETKIIRHR